jgi:hypothetical protein
MKKVDFMLFDRQCHRRTRLLEALTEHNEVLITVSIPGRNASVLLPLLQGQKAPSQDEQMSPECSGT